ncbi:hypothetical protein ABFX02_05G128200 [Erythranthe guttata]
MAAVAAIGGSINATREARRRRIVERGSDRLALITGRIQSLPSEPDESPKPANLSGQKPADSAVHEDLVSDSSLTNQESRRESIHRDFLVETKDPLPPRAPLRVNEELSQISSFMVSTELNQQLDQNRVNSFTSGKINAAISASEKIRMYSNIAVAILVIFSYMQFPVLGCSSIRSILIFRPVYLLFLTNVSIVVARLFLGIQGAEIRNRQRSSGVLSFIGKFLIGQMGKSVESVLLLQNILRALFMDFSIYAVVLVCGLSLMQRLGFYL